MQNTLCNFIECREGRSKIIHPCLSCGTLPILLDPSQSSSFLCLPSYFFFSYLLFCLHEALLIHPNESMIRQSFQTQLGCEDCLSLQLIVSLHSRAACLPQWFFLFDDFLEKMRLIMKSWAWRLHFIERCNSIKFQACVIFYP